MLSSKNRFSHKNQSVETPETESKEIANGNGHAPPQLPGIDAQTIKEKPAAPSPIMSANSQQMLSAKVGPILENNEIASLSRTNKTIHRLFEKSLIKAREALVKKLLQHVAYGEEKEADSLLEKHPYLLDYADTVTDYAGRRIHGTAYQIALGAEDEHMLAMLQRHFSRLENGREAMQAQHAAQFPAAEEKAWALRKSQDREELRRVIQTLSAAPNEEACARAIQAFHDYMDKPRGDEDGVIRTGRHFNVWLLWEAFRFYADNYEQMDRWSRSSWKNTCFWLQVIGYIQRHLPACYAQAFCQGILGIIEDGEAFRRSLKFQYNLKDVLFFPLDSNADFRLGHDYAGQLEGRCGKEYMTGPLSIGSFKDFIRQKQRACINIIAQNESGHSRPSPLNINRS